MGPLEPAFFIATMLVALVGFVVSSTVGVGGAILLIPMLAMQLPPSQAVALSAPVMLVNNIMKAWVFRRSIDWQATWRVSLLAVPAAFGAALMLGRVDERGVLIGVGVLIVASLVLDRAQAVPLRVSGRGLVFFGALTGAISGLCGAAGPPTALGLKGYGLVREAFVATVAVFAIVLQLAKLPAYFHAGVLPSTLWPLALCLSSMALLAVWMAPALLRRMSARTFARALDAVLILSAVWIFVDVWRRSA